MENLIFEIANIILSELSKEDSLLTLWPTALDMTGVSAIDATKIKNELG